MKNYTHENIRLGTHNLPREGLRCDGINHHRRMHARLSEIIICVGTNELHEIRGQVCIIMLWTGRCFLVCLWVSERASECTYPSQDYPIERHTGASGEWVSSSLVTAFVLTIIFCVSAAIYILLCRNTPTTSPE